MYYYVTDYNYPYRIPLGLRDFILISSLQNGDELFKYLEDKLKRPKTCFRIIEFANKNWKELLDKTPHDIYTRQYCETVWTKYSIE